MHELDQVRQAGERLLIGELEALEVRAFGVGGSAVPPDQARIEQLRLRGVHRCYGGTILGTTNRGNPFTHVVTRPDGTREERDRSGAVLEAFRRHRLDALIAVGGDGSLSIALQCHHAGIPVVGEIELFAHGLRERKRNVV